VKRAALVIDSSLTTNVLVNKKETREVSFFNYEEV
jgi:hypothetical protein